MSNEDKQKRFTLRIDHELFDKVKGRLTIYGSGAVNINTADEIVLRSIGMSDELAAKIIRFRGDPGKMTDENVFQDPARISEMLAKKESLSGEESGEIGKLVGSGLLSVTSDNFGGTAVGNAGGKAQQGSARIAFIFDRKENVLRYWRE